MTDRGVVFDIGGVLEYTASHSVRTGKWAQRLGIPQEDFDARLAQVWEDGSYGRITEAQVHTRIGEILEIDQATVDAFMADNWVEYLGTVNTELLAYFRSLRSRCPTGILSNSFVGAREREHGPLGLDGLCDIIVYSHEVGFYKPEPEIYALTCERLGLPAARVAFLDDYPEYLSGAQAVGMHAIPFTDNASAIQAIEAWLSG